MRIKMTNNPNMNKYFVVKNIHGTTGLRCSCRSWIQHWKNGASSFRATCAVLGFSNEAKVGAHVISVDKRTDRQWWIAPFCKTHNQHYNEKKMALKSQVTLISANRGITCNANGW
jgi:hypothetical protein